MELVKITKEIEQYKSTPNHYGNWQYESLVPFNADSRNILDELKIE